jgi:hypothetical protein
VARAPTITVRLPLRRRTAYGVKTMFSAPREAEREQASLITVNPPHISVSNKPQPLGVMKGRKKKQPRDKNIRNPKGPNCFKPFCHDAPLKRG